MWEVLETFPEREWLIKPAEMPNFLISRKIIAEIHVVCR